MQHNLVILESSHQLCFSIERNHERVVLPCNYCGIHEDGRACRVTSHVAVLCQPARESAPTVSATMASRRSDHGMLNKDSSMDNERDSERRHAADDSSQSSLQGQSLTLKQSHS